MKNRLSKVKLGILGSGQLARMLTLKSHEMGIQPYILGSHPQSPASKVSSHFVKGSLHSKRDLKNFLNKVNLAIFENEFLDPVLLHEASLASNTPIHPRPKVMNLLQDRLSQKKLLRQHKVPTADFMEMPSSSSALTGMFSDGAVLKKRRQGYDGCGTFISKNIEKDQKAWEFVKKNPKGLIVEKYIPFKRELALILVRNRKKQVVEMPLVETFQENACCVWVKGPCRHTKKNSLVRKLKTLMNEIEYEGVMAFEIFETQKGDLLVNELAPRVHNSGHYSLNALSEDQFSLHIKAVLNMDISAPVLRAGGFAMLNLLGLKKSVSFLPPKGIALHWYDKKEAHPGRKMGHLNNLDTSPNKALSPLLDFLKKIQKEEKV